MAGRVSHLGGACSTDSFTDVTLTPCFLPDQSNAVANKVSHCANALNSSTHLSPLDSLISTLQIHKRLILETADGYILIENFEGKIGIVYEDGQVNLIVASDTSDFDIQVRKALQDVIGRVESVDLKASKKAWNSVEDFEEFKAALEHGKIETVTIQRDDKKIIFYDSENFDIEQPIVFEGERKEEKFNLYLRHEFKFGDPRKNEQGNFFGRSISILASTALLASIFLPLFQEIVKMNVFVLRYEPHM